MISFSIWDMVRHLLTGAGWTIVLSAIAFALGGVMGLIVLFVRISPKAQMRALAIAVRKSLHAFGKHCICRGRA